MGDDGRLQVAGESSGDGEGRRAAVKDDAVTTTPTAAPSCSLTEEGEDIEILELADADALRMIADGLIADGKTIMLLYGAAIDGPFTDAV